MVKSSLEHDNLRRMALRGRRLAEMTATKGWQEELVPKLQSWLAAVETAMDQAAMDKEVLVAWYNRRLAYAGVQNYVRQAIEDGLAAEKGLAEEGR
ncbi:MAG: hypothetical protein HQK56_06205 [Deltaproteobacteria bacterium]|nr:hypothetical protein [Deltaproteobacteria bacterium]